LRRAAQRARSDQRHERHFMIFKIIAFIAAAIPIVLFLRTMFFRRPTRVSASFDEFKKQANLAVTIFLVLICCVVAVALGKLVWTWWSPY
jgi:hypothetical protein